MTQEEQRVYDIDAARDERTRQRFADKAPVQSDPAIPILSDAETERDERTRQRFADRRKLQQDTDEFRYQAGVDADAKESAEADRISGESGDPYAMTKQHLDVARRDRKLRRLRQDIGTNPYLDTFYSNPINVDIASDESGLLNGITYAFQGFGDSLMSTDGPYFAGPLTEQLAQGIGQQFDFGVKSLYQKFNRIQNMRAVGEEYVEAAKLTAAENAELELQYQKDRIPFMKRAKELEKKLNFLTPKDMNIWQQSLRSAARSGVQMVASLPGMVLGPGGVALLLAAQVESESYMKAVAAGKSDTEASAYGITQGAIEYAFERYPTGILLRLFRDKSPAKQALKYMMVEQITEQGTTIFQTLGDLGFGLDKELASAIERGDIREARNIVLEKLALTAISTLMLTGGITGVQQGYVANANRKDRKVASELREAVGGENVAAIVEVMNRIDTSTPEGLAKVQEELVAQGLVDPETGNLLVQGEAQGDMSVTQDEEGNISLGEPTQGPNAMEAIIALQRSLVRESVPEVNEVDAQARVDRFKAQAAEMSKSTTFKEAKDRFEALLNSASDADIQINIEDAELYFQPLGATAFTEAMDELGVTEAQMKDAKYAGNNITIPLSKFMAHSDSQYFDSLLMDARLETGKDTLREARLKAQDALMRGATETIEAAEAILAKEDKAGAFAMESQAIYNNFYGQYLAAGFDTDKAHTLAIFKKAFYTTAASKEEISPMEAWSRRTVQVEGFGVTQRSPNMAVGQSGGAYADTSLAGTETYNQFAGVNAETAALDQLATAKQLEGEGGTRSDILDATGWFKMPDGMWRFEISDDQARWNPEIEDAGITIEDALKGGHLNDNFNRRDWRLDEVLDHPKLFEAYPEIGAARITLKMTTDTSKRASINRETGKITFYSAVLAPPSGEEMLTTLLHEIQHAIQKIEGFATGGSPDQFAAEVRQAEQEVKDLNVELSRVAANMDQLRALNTPEAKVALKEAEDDYQGLLDARRKQREILYEEMPYEKYLSLHGESEARETEKRQDLSPEERVAQLSEMAQMPPKAFIITINNSVVSSSQGDTFNQGPISSKPITPEQHARAMLEAEWTPTIASTGRINGAPEWFTNADVDMKILDNLINSLLLEGMVGRYWYEYSADAILKMVGGEQNLVDAEKMAQIIAIYSANATVPANTTSALKAYHHWKSGKSRSSFSVKTEIQDKKAIGVLYDNQPFQGEKTGSFYGNLIYDLVERFPDRMDELSLTQAQHDELKATIDVWMYRAYGYLHHSGGGVGIEAGGTGLTKDTKYNFVENHVKKIAAEMNLSGNYETFITPHQVQAIIWTAMKARYEIASVKEATNKLSIEAGVLFLHESGPNKGKPNFGALNSTQQAVHDNNWRDEAMKIGTAEATRNAEEWVADYSDTLQQHTRVATWEALPSTKFNHPINDASFLVRQFFTDAVKAIFIDEETGFNELAHALGAPNTYSSTGHGAYDGGVNPNVITYLLPLKENRLNRKGEPSDVWIFGDAEVSNFARIMQFATMQDAVPWYRKDYTANRTKANKALLGFKVVYRGSGSTVNNTGHLQTLEEVQEFVDNYNKKASEKEAVLLDDGRIVIKGTGRLVPGTKKITKKKAAKEFVEARNEKLQKKYLRAQGSKFAVGITFGFTKDISPAMEIKLLDLLVNAVGNEYLGFTKTDPRTIDLINFRDDTTKVPGVSDEVFKARIKQVSDELKALGATEQTAFYAEGQYGPIFNWKGRPVGKGLLQGTPAGKQNKLRKSVLRWRASYEALLDEYSGSSLEELEAFAAWVRQIQGLTKQTDNQIRDEERRLKGFPVRSPGEGPKFYPGIQPNRGDRKDHPVEEMPAGLNTEEFFREVTQGIEGRSDVPYKIVIRGVASQEGYAEFAAEYAKRFGHFDDHIARSIPGYREIQTSVGNAIVQNYGKYDNMLDLGGSEGSFAITITSMGGPKVEIVDPNQAMHQSFMAQKNRPQGVYYNMNPFTYNGETPGEVAWTEGKLQKDGTIKEGDESVVFHNFTPMSKEYDVVHEAMLFQFLDDSRIAQIDAASKLLKKKGVLILEEKFSVEDKTQRAANEAKKNTAKGKYFSDKDMAEKSSKVLEGMHKNQVGDSGIESILAEKFQYVAQFWDSGNFKGYIASNDMVAIRNMLDSIGDTSSRFDTRPGKQNRTEIANPIGSPDDLNKWNQELGMPVRSDGTVPLTHWSNTSGLVNLDPGFYGTAGAGQEAARIAAGAPSRVFFGLPGYSLESSVQATTVARYEATSVKPEDLYDIHNDPRNLRPEQGSYEQAIIEAGFSGTWNPDRYPTIVAMFNKPSVREVDLHDTDGNIDTLAKFNQAPVKAAFKESDYRDSVINWAKTKFGLRTDPEGQLIWQNFVSWFGDSVVVDDTGAPLMVYHGAKGGGFKEFSYNAVYGDKGNRGFFFAADEGIAQTYTPNNRTITFPTGEELLNNPSLFDDLEVEILYGIISKDASREGLEFMDDGDLYNSEAEATVDLEKNEVVVPWYRITDQGHSLIDTADRQEAIDAIEADVENRQAGIYETYLKIENPLEVDFEGNNWNDGPPEIKYDLLDETGKHVFSVGSVEVADSWIDANPEGSYEVVHGVAGMTTDQYVEEGKSEGYDGAIFRNVVDVGPHGGGIGATDVFVAFDENTIKSEENLGLYGESANILKQPNAAPTSPDENRGSIQFTGKTKDGTLLSAPTLITLFETADFSTAVHETSHFFLEMYLDMVRTGEATEAIRADVDAMLEWFGVENAADVTRAHHEMFASAFEKYVFEGKAPTKELEPAFEAAAKWMNAVYKMIKEIKARWQGLGGEAVVSDVNLDDSARAIFDRMLGSEEAIEQEAAALDMDLNSPAVDQARKEHRVNVLAQIRALLQGDTDRQRIQTQVEDDLAQGKTELSKAVIAKTFLTTGKFPEGTPHPEGWGMWKLDRQQINELYGKDSGVEWKGRHAFSEEGGLDLDQAADLLGFTSGDQLVQVMQDTPTWKQAVKQETSRIQSDALKAEDILSRPGAMNLTARDALHNAERGKEILKELSELEGQLSGKTQGRAERAAAKDSVRKAAQGIVSRQKRPEMKPHQFLTAEKTAIKKVGFFLGRGNKEKAAMWKRRQLFNFEMYMATRDAIAKIDGMQKYLSALEKRLGKKDSPKKWDIDYILKMEEMLLGYEFTKNVSKRELEKRRSMLDFVERETAAGMSIDIPTNRLDKAQLKNYKEMTYAELQDLVGDIKHLDHLGKMKKKLFVGISKKRLQERIDSAVEEMRKRRGREAGDFRTGESEFDKKRNTASAFWSNIIQIEKMLNILDGNKRGPVTAALWDDISDAQNEAVKWKAEAGQELGKLFDMYGVNFLFMKLDKPKKYFKKRFHDASTGRDFSHEELIAVALNTGNEGNYARLQTGNKWSDSQISSILSHMEARDWKFVQGVWDYLDFKMWPRVAQHEKDMKGRVPEKVEGVSQVNKDLRGGYYPIKYNPDFTNLNIEFNAETSVDQMFGGNHASTSTKKGHTEARVENVNEPVDLTLTVLTAHINNVIQDVTHRAAVSDALRLIKDKTFKKVFIEKAGLASYNELMPWLRDVAGAFVQPIDGVDKTIGILRANVSVAAMGASLMTAMVNVSGLLTMPRHVGLVNMVGKMTAFSAGFRMKSMIKAVRSKSDYMAARPRHLARDMTNDMQQLSKGGMISVKTATWFYFIGLIDTGVSIIGWTSAYDQAIAKGDSDAAAVRYADGIVRMTQGAGRAADLTGAERGGPVKKLFTMFFGFFGSVSGQMQGIYFTTKEKGLINNSPQMMAFVMYEMLLMVAMDALVRGDWHEPEDESEKEKKKREAKIAAAFMTYPFQVLPGVRDVIQPIIGKAMDAPVFGYQMTPLSSVGESIERGAGAAISLAKGDKEMSAKAAWQMIEPFLFLKGLPIYGPKRTINAAWNQLTGETEPGVFKTPGYLIVGDKENK